MRVNLSALRAGREKMKFIYEVKSESNHLGEANWIKLRTMLLCFENMINTVFPAIRVHFKEEE